MTPAHGHVLLDTSVVIDYPAAAVAAHAETAERATRATFEAFTAH